MTSIIHCIRYKEFKKGGVEEGGKELIRIVLSSDTYLAICLF